MMGAGPRVTSADLKTAATLGIHTTPTFFVGIPLSTDRIRVVRRISGLRPAPDFRAAIEDALSAR